MCFGLLFRTDVAICGSLVRVFHDEFSGLRLEQRPDLLIELQSGLIGTCYCPCPLVCVRSPLSPDSATLWRFLDV